MPERQPLILVVDDDPDFLGLYRQVLEKGGYQVQCCATPDDALAAMAVERPALVITDLMMGALDAGFSFARSVRADSGSKPIPIIVITAVSSKRGFDFRPQTTDDLAAMQVDAYFEKPVEPRSLLEKVRTLLTTDVTESPGSEGLR
jgi:CheY-like chemotaxis protein